MSARRVGIEVEFSGLSIDDALSVVVAELDGSSEALSDHEHLVHVETNDEPYRLEVDFELLKQLSKADRDDPEVLRTAAISVLNTAAALATPLEIVTPPIDFDDVQRIVQLTEALESAGAVGTQESLVYAFGVHFNPEIKDLGPINICRHIQAYLCLHDWLKMRDDMDITRQMTAFAEPFPAEYEELCLQNDYGPDIATLIDDYLVHNPTRNRALDMLPLFAHLDDVRVRAAVDDDRVKARPTFHYRLPSCRLGAIGWSLLKPWTDWLTVERVAREPALLASLAEQRLNHLSDWSLGRDSAAWIIICERHLADL